MPVPAAEGHQERQLISGRYRLVSFHRGDERTEVWRALDESEDKVVTLEFLRDREPPSRERFLAEGRRMAGIGRPSVVRVAAIHDDADATFVVLEHVVHSDVTRDRPKPAAEKAVPILKMIELPTVAAPTVAPVAPAPAKAMALPDDATAVAVSSEAQSDEALTTLVDALRARKLSLLDTSLVKESALEIAASVRSFIEDLHLEDLHLDEVVAEARALLERAIAEARALLDRTDMSVVKSAVAQASVASHRLASLQPRLHVPGPPRIHIPAPRVSRPPKVRTPRVKVAAPPKPAAARAQKSPGRPLIRVRWGRVLSRGLSLGLIAAVVIALPPELLTKIESELAATLSQIQRAVTPSGSGLARATFELPPLSSYGAAFEAQGPYPTASPNGTVEWVVALRNSGSAGWYRGIDGAQASLALPDGTSAAVQSTPYVGPGQVGWFVVHFPAPAQPGTYKVALTPRIDGRGSLPDLGIYATVTVSPNP